MVPVKGYNVTGKKAKTKVCVFGAGECWDSKRKKTHHIGLVGDDHVVLDTVHARPGPRLVRPRDIRERSRQHLETAAKTKNENATKQETAST